MVNSAYILFPVIFIVIVLVLLLWELLFIKPRRRILQGLQYRKDNIIMIDKMANFYGVESKGLSQIRGNGVLFFEKNQLSFIKFIPKTRIDIPVENIISLETPKVFLGKTNFKPLLKVNFKLNDGTKDSVAWLLSSNDLQIWLQKIQGLTQK